MSFLLTIYLSYVQHITELSLLVPINHPQFGCVIFHSCILSSPDFPCLLQERRPAPRYSPNKMEAYADTPREVLETIDYLEQLKHQIVRPASDDSECSICLEPFSSAGRGHANDSSAEAEMPVSLPCGHIIGFKCMERYLSPFGEARNSW